MKVLIVEDEPLVALDIEGTLEEAGFAPVTVAATVETALSLIEDDGFDLAVVDANLKGRSAGPVAEALMARGVPFLGISGYARNQRPCAFDAAPFLPKPFSPLALVRALQAIHPWGAPRNP